MPTCTEDYSTRPAQSQFPGRPLSPTWKATKVKINLRRQTSLGVPPTRDHAKAQQFDSNCALRLFPVKILDQRI